MMERVKNILVVCALLACVAPAMAGQIFMIGEGAGIGGWTNTNFQGSTVTYNPNPDQAAVDQFWTDYAPTFNDPAEAPLALQYPSPWYTFTAVPAGTVPGPDDEVRSTWGGDGIRMDGTHSIGTLRFGDAYWPNQRVDGVNYQFGGMYARDSGPYNFTVGNMIHGRNPDEVLNNHSPANAQLGVTAAPLAISTFVNFRYTGDGLDSTVNIGQITMLRDSTLWGNGFNDPSSLQISTRGHNNAAGAVDLKINIGDIHLNEEWLYLELTGGTTTISGTIDYIGNVAESKGSLVTLLTGVRQGASANLRLNSWSVLMELIEDGQLFVYNTSTLGGTGAPARTYFREQTFSGEQGFFNRLASGVIRQVTSANMFDELDITYTGVGDQINVRIYDVGAIPEPATMVLLGLGAVAVFRRKR